MHRFECAKIFKEFNTIFNYMVLFFFLIVVQLNVPVRAGTGGYEPDSSASTLTLNLADWLETKGINYEFVFTADLFSNIRGGAEQGTAFLDNFDFTFEFDLHKLFDWHGATSYFYFLGNTGKMPNDFAGTVQGISNIETISTFKIYQLWLQQNLFDDKLSILAGLFDLNTEFDTRETSSLFINPTHGIGWDYAQSGENGPSIFPTTSLALRIKLNLSEAISLRAAVFDATPGDPQNPYGTVVKLKKDDGLLFSTELSYETGEVNKMDANFARYVFGGWVYTAEFQEINSVKESSGNFGFYGFIEKFLYSKNTGAGQGLAFFTRAGYANNKFNYIDYCASGGFVYYGLFNSRPEDRTGIAFAWARKSKKIIDGINDSYELNIELTHSANISPWFNIQPNIQYIINPGINGSNRNSLVIGSRVSISI